MTNKLPLDFLVPPEVPPPNEAGDPIPIGYWDPQILAEAQLHGGLPIVLVMWPADLKHFLDAKDALLLLRLLKDQLTNFLGLRNPGDMVPLPDDAFITQHDCRVPKELYVRLAKSKAFPSTKFGKVYVAQWGRVKAVLQQVDVADGEAADEVSNLCAELGLRRKEP